MRRFHLFEIHDFSWCPRTVRDGLTDYLAQSARDRQVYEPVLPLIVEAARALSVTSVIDLCSGGGGPWVHWFRSRAVLPISRVTLTDKFPNWKMSDCDKNPDLPAGLSYAAQSVDAAAVPDGLRGFRTLFTSFHHFQPDAAHAILRDAFNQRQPIGIFEFTERSVTGLLIMLLSVPSVWLATPRIRPFKWSRLIFTYLIPVIPLVVMFDGIVSALRTYTPPELLAMAKETCSAADGSGAYVWKAGLAKGATRWAQPVTYLIGLPSPGARDPDSQHPDSQHPDSQHPDSQHPSGDKEPQ